MHRGFGPEGIPAPEASGFARTILKGAIMAKWSETVGTGLAGLGRFLDKDERHGLADMPVRLLSIHDDPLNRFGARWVVSLAYLDTGEKICIGLKRNPTRDGMLEGARAALAKGEVFEPILIKLAETKNGNETYAFSDAPDEMLAQVVAQSGADDLAALMAIEPWTPDDDETDDTPASERPTPGTVRSSGMYRWSAPRRVSSRPHPAAEPAALPAAEPAALPGEKLRKADA